MATLLMVLATGTAGSATVPTGPSTCRASVIRMTAKSPGSQTVEPLVANPAGTPCASGSVTAVEGQGFVLPVGTGGGQTVEASVSYATTGGAARTDPLNPCCPSVTPFANAEVQPMSVTIHVLNLGTIRAEIGHSFARAFCFEGTTAEGFSGVSEVVLDLGGAYPGIALVPVDFFAPVDISLGELGTLHVDQKVHTPGGITQRALVLDNPLFEVVISEAEAGLGAGACP